ncbi:EPIDERMAL PATTERNING FACTOR-like protein [Corchorus olitorius]|uniref:Epidermal patterning factor-like protein n=1 Tax=Corchorus olitorius TaxID=93759 RepID=A0A1R3JA22_9ROSI|nr:EPIDERMAL PATTERNING FACTOR-like protein [Corchorus olitorius]
MKQKMFYFLIIALQIISCWFDVSTRCLAFHDDAATPRQGEVAELLRVAFDSKQGVEISKSEEEEIKNSRKLGRLGSRPPNCQRKCGRCTPCIAIQIPTTTDKLGIQYTNYEPEGWKCKCGSTFFNP